MGIIHRSRLRTKDDVSTSITLGPLNLLGFRSDEDRHVAFSVARKRTSDHPRLSLMGLWEPQGGVADWQLEFGHVLEMNGPSRTRVPPAGASRVDRASSSTTRCARPRSPAGQWSRKTSSSDVRPAGPLGRRARRGGLRTAPVELRSVFRSALAGSASAASTRTSS